MDWKTEICSKFVQSNHFWHNLCLAQITFRSSWQFLIIKSAIKNIKIPRFQVHKQKANTFLSVKSTFHKESHKKVLFFKEQFTGQSKNNLFNSASLIRETSVFLPCNIGWENPPFLRVIPAFLLGILYLFHMERITACCISNVLPIK